MIYTVTLNPALDYTVDLNDKLKTGQVNRVEQSRICCGGKGVNVSIMLTRLGVPNTALGFAAGKTGSLFLDKLNAQGVNANFLTPVSENSGETRINIKLKHNAPFGVTEINAQGPILSESDIENLIDKLNVKDGDFIVLAGSLPASLGIDVYEKIIASMKNKNTGKIKIVLDASGDLLKNSLKHKPFLVKPNAEETAELVGFLPKTHNEAVKAALKIQDLSGGNVLISLGKNGSVLLTETDKIFKQQAPLGFATNAVGAGDSMIAGFLVGYLKYGGDFKKALLLGTAAGSATAFSEWLAERDDVLDLYNRLEAEHNN